MHERMRAGFPLGRLREEQDVSEPWRIRIESDAAMDGIAIQVARKVGDGLVEQVKFASDRTVTPLSEAVATMPAPSLTIDDSLGRALLDALAAHYGGTTGGLQQRADFEHERQRVDRLIGALIAAPQLGGGS
jgi:hypothetical protein